MLVASRHVMSSRHVVMSCRHVMSRLWNFGILSSDRAAVLLGTET